jgi:glutathione S-transferase
MSLILYGYTWKAAIALDEKGLAHEFRSVDPETPEHGAELAAHWPPAKFPVLVDGDTPVIESSIIIEHLDLYPGGPRLIPADPAAALPVRFMDRLFDNHVMASTQAVVSEHLPFITPTPDPARIDRAKSALDVIYSWLEDKLPDAEWACGEAFTLADCAAAPSLFYADWVHPIGEGRPRLCAYRARLLDRPSVARAVDGARPYRHYWPLGPIDRD